MSSPAFRRAIVAELTANTALGEVGAGLPGSDGSYPYARVIWDVAEGRALNGDARAMWGMDELQVSIWEHELSEDGSVARGVKDDLDGLRADGIRLSWSSSQRIEEDGDIVHTVMTFRHRAPFHT